MHGDGRGMSVGEAEQEHYFSPTRGNGAAAGPPAAGAAPRQSGTVAVSFLGAPTRE